MSSSDSSSFVLEGGSSFLEADPSTPQTHDSSDLDSLPSSDTVSSLDDDDTELDSDAEREWRESLQQIELLLTMVVVPYLGKYFGRKCAYWGWAKFMEWKYPGVEVSITNPKLFKVAGAAEAAAAL